MRRSLRRLTESSQAFAVLDWTVMAASVGTVIDVGKSISLAQALSMASLSVVAAVSTACAVACVKASVGFSLLRLQNHTRWKWFLWPMIILQGVIAAFQTIMMTTRCIPLEGVWNPNVAAKCWDVNVFRISFTVSSILVILTDIIFSLAPLSFIFRIRASWRQKLAIGILMAAGLFASAASIAKTLAIQSFGSSGNPAATGIKVAVWASVEGQVGIIVASLPCLKATLERMCIRFRSAEKLDTRTEDLAVHNGTVYLG